MKLKITSAFSILHFLFVIVVLFSQSSCATQDPPEPRETTAAVMWTGKIHARFVQKDGSGSQQWDVDIAVRLREEGEHRVSPDSPLVFTTFDPSGSVVHNALKVTTGEMTCAGEGRRTHRGRPGGGSTLVMKTGDGTARELLGYDFPRGETAYMLAIRLPSAEQFTVLCQGADGSTSFLSPFIYPVVGRVENYESFDPFPRFTRGGIMSGSYTASSTDGLEMFVAWSVCRDGVTCPEMNSE